MTLQEEPIVYSNEDVLHILQDHTQRQQQMMAEIYQTFVQDMYCSLPEVPNKQTTTLIVEVHQAFTCEYALRATIDRLACAVAENDPEEVEDARRDIAWETYRIVATWNDVLVLLRPEHDQHQRDLRACILGASEKASYRGYMMIQLIHYWQPDTPKSDPPHLSSGCEDAGEKR